MHVIIGHIVRAQLRVATFSCVWRAAISLRDLSALQPARLETQGGALTTRALTYNAHPMHVWKQNCLVGAWASAGS